jgi:hypothetical protein
VAVFCLAGLGATVGGLAFKVQGASVVRVQDGQGLLGGDAAFGLAGDLADALVVAAVEEAGAGGAAVDFFEFELQRVVKAGPAVAAPCAVAGGDAGDVAMLVVAVDRVGQLAGLALDGQQGVGAACAGGRVAVVADVGVAQDVADGVVAVADAAQGAGGGGAGDGSVAQLGRRCFRERFREI